MLLLGEGGGLAMTLDPAWAFLVVSDPQQADSLRDQETWAQQTAAAHGWVITRTIAGVSSGRDGPRKLTLSMIAELERLSSSDRPHRLLMIRLERLGRGDGLEAMEVFLRLRCLGIIVHTRLDGDVDAHRASELLMPVLRFFIGGMENEVRRDKLLSLYDRRRKARTGNSTVAVSAMTPYGLKYCHGRFEVVPAQASVVRFIFEMRLRGYGHGLISKRIGSLAPPMVSKAGNERCVHFSPDTVRGIVGNPHYRGTIVSDDLWYLAQKPARKFTPARNRYEYPMGGSLRCECGEALVGSRSSGNRSSPAQPRQYYQCRNVRIHGRMKHHRCQHIDDQFVQVLRRLFADEELINAYVYSSGFDEQAATLQIDLASVRAQITQFDDRRRTILRAYEEGAVSRADLKWRLDELRAKQAELLEREQGLGLTLAAGRAQGERASEIRALVRSAADTWPNAPIEDRRALAKAICCAFGGCIVTLDGALVLGDLVAHG